VKVPNAADARAAWWTWRALRSARAQLRGGAVRDVVLLDPPRVAGRATRAVKVVLKRQDPSCFERALVLQRWLAAHGIPKDLIVGTQGSASSGFKAHAWLEGESLPAGEQYAELLRLPPPTRGAAESGPSRSRQVPLRPVISVVHESDLKGGGDVQ
jgi:hypothetical protein